MARGLTSRVGTTLGVLGSVALRTMPSARAGGKVLRVPTFRCPRRAMTQYVDVSPQAVTRERLG